MNCDKAGIKMKLKHKVFVVLFLVMLLSIQLAIVVVFGRTSFVRWLVGISVVIMCCVMTLRDKRIMNLFKR